MELQMGRKTKVCFGDLVHLIKMADTPINSKKPLIIFFFVNHFLTKTTGAHLHYNRMIVTKFQIDCFKLLKEVIVQSWHLIEANSRKNSKFVKVVLLSKNYIFLSKKANAHLHCAYNNRLRSCLYKLFRCDGQKGGRTAIQAGRVKYYVPANIVMGAKKDQISLI